MIEILTGTQGKILGLQLSGTLTDEDYGQITPRIEEIIQREGAIRLLCVLEDFHGWTAKAAWDDLKLDIKHHSAYERLAIVGTSKMEKFITWISKPFVKGEVKFFPPEEVNQAWEWIRA